MAGARTCEQCGAVFEPRREHARFCCPRCRLAWNREDTSGPYSADTALGWSLTAMGETTRRLTQAKATDWPQALAAISEAVWWVTIVDATMVRYHPEAYDRALDGLARAERQATEDTFAGLRFVRNQMGYYADPADFICPGNGTGDDRDALVARWTWKPIPETALGPVPPPRRAWEISRHQAYQAQLADHAVGDTFGRATSFLSQLSAIASPPGEASTPAGP